MNIEKLEEISSIETLKNEEKYYFLWCKFSIFLLGDPSQCDYLHPQCEIIGDLCEKQLKGTKINWKDHYFQDHNYCYKHTVYAYDKAATTKVMSIHYALSVAEALAYFFDIYHRPDFIKNKKYRGYPGCILQIATSTYVYNRASNINPNFIAYIYDNYYRKDIYMDELFSKNKQEEKFLELWNEIKD